MTFNYKNVCLSVGVKLLLDFVRMFLNVALETILKCIIVLICSKVGNKSTVVWN